MDKLKLVLSPWRWRTSTYNGLCLVFGAWCATDTLATFLGVVFLGEAVLCTLEKCWPREVREQEGME